MTPYYSDKWVTIYHGDCREILPQLDKVDLVLTDPPYGIGEAAGKNLTRGNWTAPIIRVTMLFCLVVTIIHSPLPHAG
jgi:tRNA G10  N-methylase Trm11